MGFFRGAAGRANFVFRGFSALGNRRQIVCRVDRRGFLHRRGRRRQVGWYYWVESDFVNLDALPFLTSIGLDDSFLGPHSLVSKSSADGFTALFCDDHEMELPVSSTTPNQPTPRNRHPNSRKKRRRRSKHSTVSSNKRKKKKPKI